MRNGGRIRALREARGWSLTDLADRAGVGRTALWQAETNKTAPTVDTLKRLAQAFGVSVGELAGETVAPNTLSDEEQALLAAVRNGNMSDALILVGNLLDKVTKQVNGA